MAITTQDMILILRNVTGRVDASDPQFTDSIMLTYLQNFITLEATQDVRLFKQMTWYEFEFGPTDLNPFPVDLQTLVLNNSQVPSQIGASTIGPPAYADGFPVF